MRAFRKSWRLLEVENVTTIQTHSLNKLCKTKKRVLLLGPLPPTVGGITTFITSILNSRLNKKYTFIPFGTERPTAGVGRDMSNYTVVFRIGLYCLIKSTIYTISHLLSFPFALLKKRPDIVHVCTASYWSFWENAVYVLISKIFSKKTLLHIHGGGFDDFSGKSNRFLKFLIRITFNLPDKVIVLSSTWKRVMENFASENKISVLSNFVSFSRFDRSRSEVNLPKDTIQILFVGGVAAKQKGLYDLLKAMPLVTKRFKNILFLFMGCTDIGKLSAIIQREKISSHAIFLGYLHGDEKIEVFVESDIFVLPSYAEGLPLTILEAMAAGLPIIATAVGAVPEIIENGENGFLIEPGNYKELAKKILILAQDEKLRLEMRQKNIEKIKEKYDEKVVIPELENQYHRLFEVKN
jgi:glycosyltransferase involved in cell wall biosynthesis